MIESANAQSGENGPITIWSPEIRAFDSLFITTLNDVSTLGVFATKLRLQAVFPNSFGTIALRTPLDVVSRTSSDELFVLIPIDDMALAS
jgi:hypothetical protein